MSALSAHYTETARLIETIVLARVPAWFGARPLSDDEATRIGEALAAGHEIAARRSDCPCGDDMAPGLHQVGHDAVCDPQFYERREVQR